MLLSKVGGWRFVTYYPPVLTQARIAIVLVLAVTPLAAQRTSSEPPLASSQTPPAWAYVANPMTGAVEPPAVTPQHVPGSKETYTLKQIADLYSVPDWHPDGHPAMPPIVAQGRKPEVFACGYCHLPNGLGRPENAGLAGLPKEYIVQQMAAFQSGARKSAMPDLLPAKNMVLLAAHANTQEVAAAASYFAGLKPKPWIRVIETATAPKTHVAGWMLAADTSASKEPVGSRILEVPENLDLTELRDDASSFIAYVPPGSLKRGKVLVEKGGDGVTLPCAMCHGNDLRGKDNVPSIAGRSPSYLVRQFYDMQLGTRAGDSTDQMQAPVMKLTMDDVIAIAAYLASLKP
jgi:cytochrome c553